MTNRAIRRIYRAATPEELEEDRRVRAQIAGELPELRQLGRELLETLKIYPSKIAQITQITNDNHQSA